MNPRPIETAQDEDLRLSRQAMQRAALRAWEIAARTGTAIIIRRAGAIEADDDGRTGPRCDFPGT